MTQDKACFSKVKMEPIDNEREDVTQSSSISSLDMASQRLSFVEKEDTLKDLIRRTIYFDSMKNFIGAIKQEVTHLTFQDELDLLLLAVNCIDLTTLSGDDTSTNIERLCYRAIHSLDEDNLPQHSDLTCAAVCVYPARVPDCLRTFNRIIPGKHFNIAAVATGFPSGQFSLKTRLCEISDAVQDGANEIDVVINRAAALAGNWPLLFEELCEMRKACDSRKSEGHRVHLKVIIGAGDLFTSSPGTIYTASLVAILAGADFIKTSTGKESVNATLPIGYIMMRAIMEYYQLTQIQIGFKPAGGIRTSRDALEWLILVKRLLGPDWLDNKFFRFGASGLLDDIEKRISQLSKILNEQDRLKPSNHAVF